MYLYLSISPLPIVALVNTEIRACRKEFLKLFGAASLQGVLLFYRVEYLPTTSEYSIFHLMRRRDDCSDQCDRR